MIDKMGTMLFIIKDPATKFKQLRHQHDLPAEPQPHLILLLVRELEHPALFMPAQAIVAKETEKGIICMKVNVEKKCKINKKTHTPKS